MHVIGHNSFFFVFVFEVRLLVTILCVLSSCYSTPSLYLVCEQQQYYKLVHQHSRRLISIGPLVSPLPFNSFWRAVMSLESGESYAAPPALVLDSGSSTIKCGRGGSHFPACILETVVGRPTTTALPMPPILDALEGRDTRVPPSDGSEAPYTPASSPAPYVCGDVLRAYHDDLIDYERPIRNGIVQNMDAVECLWSTAFAGCLNVNNSDTRDLDLQHHSLVLSESPLTSIKTRSAVFEVFFETYRIAAVQSAAQGVLALFANGLQTGVAVDVGESLSHCTAIYDGYAMPKAHRIVDVGGAGVTSYLAEILQQRGQLRHSTTTSSRSTGRSSFGDEVSARRMVQQLKERFCYTAVDAALEYHLHSETAASERLVQLPDGGTCRLGPERFEAPECLFQPHLVGVESPGLSAQLWDCIQAADVDLRSSLYRHVVLSGGSSMFPGLSTRLERDLRGLYLEGHLKGDRSRLSRFPLAIEDRPCRSLTVFQGGAALAALSADAPDMWMSRAEWEEGGVSAVIARFGVGS